MVCYVLVPSYTRCSGCTSIQYYLFTSFEGANFPAIMFQSTSASVALLSTIGLVLHKIELRDNILEYQIVIVSSCHQDLKSKPRVDMYGIISGHSTA